MNCPNCGLAAQESDKFCIGCGTPLRRPAPVEEVKESVREAAAAAPEEIKEAAKAAPETAAKELDRAMNEAEAAFAPAPVLTAEPVVPEAPAPVQQPVQPAPVQQPVQPAPVQQPAPVNGETCGCKTTKLDKPLSVWGYIWRILLFCIPILGIIPLFVMAFSKGVNKNSKHFASAILILILVALLAAIGGAIYLLITNDPATINEYINNLISNFKGA